MPLNEVLVDEHWAAAGGQAKHKRSFSCRVECIDSFYAWTLMTCLKAKGAAGVSTNDVVCNILRRSLGIVANNQPPRSGKRTC